MEFRDNGGPARSQRPPLDEAVRRCLTRSGTDGRCVPGSQGETRMTTRGWFGWFLATALVFGGFNSLLRASGPPESSLAASDWSSIRAAYEEARHNVFPD